MRNLKNRSVEFGTAGPRPAFPLYFLERSDLVRDNLKLQLKRGSPTILTIFGAVGVIATTIAAVKATPKALEKIKYDSRKNHEGDLINITVYPMNLIMGNSSSVVLKRF